jgi:hypothetical protein
MERERERVAVTVPAREQERPALAPEPHRTDLVLALQRSAGNRAVTTMLARGPDKDAKPKADPREPLLDKMTNGMAVSEGQRARMLEALAPFSPSQLREMVRLGVRFWGATGVPPELEGIGDSAELDPRAQGGARAAYTPTLRYIRVLPGSPVGHLMHELAHAWDNVRTGKLKPLSELLKAKDPGAAIGKEHEKTGTLMWSDAKTKHSTLDENGKKIKLTIQEMLDRYRDRHVLREQQFGTPGTREGYSQKNAQEFYAEAFAVFHAGDKEQRERLEVEAPELFHLLEKE